MIMLLCIIEKETNVEYTRANCHSQEERLFVTEQQNGELDAKGAKGANSDPLNQPSRRPRRYTLGRDTCILC
jgi:hypothetical protein